MASHLRTSLQRASTLFANRKACMAESINSHQVALMSHQLAPAYKNQPSTAENAGKMDKNIVSSSHSDCELHGMNLVHRFFYNAGKYTNKIALVCLYLSYIYLLIIIMFLVKQFGDS